MSEPGPRSGISPEAASPAVDSTALFNGRREVVIRHGPVEYRLRITKAGKLILTK